jgi:hypothetical protein
MRKLLNIRLLVPLAHPGIPVSAWSGEPEMRSKAWGQRDLSTHYGNKMEGKNNGTGAGQTGVKPQTKK